MGAGSEAGAAHEDTGATRASASSGRLSDLRSADLLGPLAVVVGDSFPVPGGGAQAAWPELLGDAAGWDVRTCADAKAAYVARAGATTMADLEAEAVDDLGVRVLCSDPRPSRLGTGVLLSRSDLGSTVPGTIR